MAIAVQKPGIDLGIVTTHGEAMLAFYRDVLQLEYKGSMPMPVGGGTMHRMLCGDSLIKLVVVDAVPNGVVPGGIGGGAGYRYWTITVKSVAEMLASCAAAGHTVVIREKEIRPGVRIGMVADPDGNWVEFLQVG
jgi:catechol 2,3-dioxygenase-like lactoylglutathione lyase family enzyme